METLTKEQFDMLDVALLRLLNEHREWEKATLKLTKKEIMGMYTELKFYADFKEYLHASRHDDLVRYFKSNNNGEGSLFKGTIKDAFKHRDDISEDFEDPNFPAIRDFLCNMVDLSYKKGK